MRELRVYGSGGPYQAVRECCDYWGQRAGLKVEVIKGQPDAWAHEAHMLGDLIYLGAENMLEEFVRKFPVIIDSKTVRCPFKRRVDIIVRQFNPHRIRSLADLAEKKARLLAVELDKMGEFFDSVPGVRQCIVETVTTGENGFAVWQSKETIDAWITYRSWYVKLTANEEFVRFGTGERTYRCTPLALTTMSRSRERALELLDYLISEETHKVFRKWGWE